MKLRLTILFCMLATVAWPQSNTVIISEFMAANNTWRDEDGESSDWIELFNPGINDINLAGWYLTDSRAELTKWRFPATILPPNGFLMVFASGKDRAISGRQLHTNFKLEAVGEYLGLVRPDGLTIASEFAPFFPSQVSGVSYGLGFLSTNSTLIAINSAVRVQVPANGNDGTNWLYPGFNDGSWTAGTNGAGYGTTNVTDIGAAMSNVNATAYIRLPFTIENPADVQLLTLRVRYDDGFVAYLNGIEVARANAPGALTHTSTATNTHSAATTDQFQLGATVLAVGANLLAIHGLNAAAADEDFLISAELTATHVAAASPGGVYMTGPTPGTANGGGVSVLGPVITEVTHSPNVPSDSQDLVVTARVSPTFASLTSVSVRYRIMFNAEIELPMLDDGLHGDGAAGDGVYGQTLPVAVMSTNGQMIRWYFRATDGLNSLGRWPLFLSPADTEYLGTIVDPTNITSLLPIFHLFAAAGVLQAPRVTPATTLTGADSEAGGRVSLFYDGEFYDNIYMEIRGNTSAGQNKKSHRLEFNREHEFRHLPGFPRIRKTSLMAEFLDPAYIRQHLSFWLLEQMGMKTPFSYPVRAQLNGSFYGLVFHNDVIGQEQVERMGYDPKGALYKAAGNVLLSRSSTGVFQKLEPDGPPDYTDYNQLVNGIVETATLANRRIAAYDMLDIPEVINYLAGARWCAENTDVWSNMSLYRDTYGDQLWRIIPFDMNASWGQRYGGITPLDAINDGCKSHPLYGGSTIIACDGSTYNRMYDVVIMVPELRQMLLRRQRTVLDRWVLEPGVPAESRLLETHIRYMTNLIWTEAFLDRASWGYSTWTASNKPLTNAITELFNEFINPRRTHWSVTHSVANVAKPIGVTPTSNAGIPLSQPLFSFLSISNVEFNPSSGDQNQEYVQISNPNNYAVDITGWKLGGAVEFIFKPGTVIPSNSVLYVSPKVRAFRARTVSPRGGEGLFVVGPYKGQLPARGETLYIVDDNGRAVTTSTYIGNPSLAQQYLRITEIMYHPAPPPEGSPYTDEDFEFIELMNIGPVSLDLTGVRLTNGVSFSFTGAAISILNPTQRVVVVKNLNAFRSIHGSSVAVAGVFTGALDNEGESFRLEDAQGETILDIFYDNAWYPVTDGVGFSLVSVDDNADPELWESKANWRASGRQGGSPGAADPPPVMVPPVLVNEVLSNAEAPAEDAIELYNPTDAEVDVSGWWLSDDKGTPKKFRIPDGTFIPAGGFLAFDEHSFNWNTGQGDQGFSFKTDGDEVYLFAGDASGNLLSYMHGFAFGAADPCVTFGRHIDSIGKEHFVAQTTNTLSRPNAGPRVGPVVISEIMYHPPDIVSGGVRTDNTADEYIELRNITDQPVPLFCTNFTSTNAWLATNTWRLDQGVHFNFPTGFVIAPHGFVLVVNFNPLRDPDGLARFRENYGVPLDVPVLGPLNQKLSNTGESLELRKPGQPAGGAVPYILVDRVDYSISPPWPQSVNDVWLSLNRLDDRSYGNDPINWTLVGPSAGSAYIVGGTAPNITTQPGNTIGLIGRTATFRVSVAGTPPFFYQWRFNGMNLPGANGPVLTLPNLQPRQAGYYRVIVLNSAGIVESSDALLSVMPPPAILEQPQPINLRGSSNAVDYGNTTNIATFTVQAVGTGAVRYQWRFNGTNIAGATGANYTINNVQLVHEGVYDVEVTDNVGAIYSAPARLSVLVNPNFIHRPLAQTVPVGSLVTLSAEVSGNPLPMTFDWRRGSTTLASNVVNRRVDFFTFTATNVPQTNSYRLVIKNAANPAPGLPSAVFNIITVEDSDNDGLPNAAETALGLNPNDPADAVSDLDHDGLSNRDEYIAGTNPTNAASYLKVDRLTAPGAVRIEFLAVSNRTYAVEAAPELPAALWTRVAEVVAVATNRLVEVLDPMQITGSTQRVYRLVTPRTP